VFHGSPFSPAGRISGPDPEGQSYRSYVSFEDPDGNAWIVQEVTRRLDARPLLCAVGGQNAELAAKVIPGKDALQKSSRDPYDACGREVKKGD
jgi:hypothetical protein